MSKTSPINTLGRKKLKNLGVELPLFPTSANSNLPKHSELIELRYKVEKGVQTIAELERKEKISTEVWIREQERLGLDVLVDGEMMRGDMLSFFAKRIDGFEMGGTLRCYGNRYYRKPIVKQKLAWKGPIAVPSWSSFQRMTHRPLKATITGPYTLMDWSFNEAYSSRESLLSDLVKIIRKEIEALADEGAKIIQIDEPALSSRPAEFSLVADAIHELTKGIHSYFIVHHSYGNISSIWEKIDRLRVDNISLEMANSEYAYLPLLKKHRTEKDISIGFIDSHSRTIEDPKTLRKTFLKVLKVIPEAQLWITTDSGLKTRTIDESIKKLKTMVGLATSARRD